MTARAPDNTVSTLRAAYARKLFKSEVLERGQYSIRVHFGSNREEAAAFSAALEALSRPPAAGGAPSVEEVAKVLLAFQSGLDILQIAGKDTVENRRTLRKANAEDILALFPTPPQPTAAGAEENAIGTAEREVGQFIYRRIEVLMNAQPDTTEGRELAYLARIVSDVEEYGATGGDVENDYAPEFTTPAVPEREDALSDLEMLRQAIEAGDPKRELLVRVKDIVALLSHLPAPEGEGDKGFGRTQERPSPSDGNGWLPIETAPKDGRRFLAFGGGLDRVETASWNEEVGCWECESVTLDDLDFEAEGYSRPTIWMHIPAAPGTAPSPYVGEGSAERLPTEPNPSAPGSAEGWRPTHPLDGWTINREGEGFLAAMMLTDVEDARAFAAWAADLAAHPANTTEGGER